ncbi:MAG: hypothetical protein HQL42_02590 [Alphaproteobacteria bacterium]|nr:hypothetical protein [Alphaproteobacteria bacterium]
MDAPDLENGYMINTLESPNRFQTFVEAALVRRGDDGTQTAAYLSSRCRPEGISPDRIFNGLLYTFGILHTDDQQTLLLHMGSSMASRRPFGERRPAQYLHRNPNCNSRVHCPRVEVVELSFDQVLDEMQSERLDRDNRVYMELSWRVGAETVSLYTSCGYTNFPNPDLDHAVMWQQKPNYPRHEHRYLQPIRGPVPYFDGERYQIAFVAAHVTQSGAQRVEFQIRDSISFFSLRPQSGWRGRIAGWLAASPVGRYFSVSEYHRQVTVPATCRFYRYAG